MTTAIDGAAADAPVCFHCGEPCLQEQSITTVIDGRAEALCCVGCEAAALAIVGCGLDAYYRLRDARPARPADTREHTEFAIYDDPLLSARYPRNADGARETALAIGGMRCAACAWLLEQRLGRVPGVRRFEVNLSTARAVVSWDEQQLGLAAILTTIAELGFDARPYTTDARRALDEDDARQLLRRLGVAAICGMQVMMISFALYFDVSGDVAGMQHFLRGAALLLTLPVLLYSAQPFLAAAVRALARAEVNMDVPVSLALLLAFAGSARHTLLGDGAVYFDSVVMFVAFLLTSRWLELRARVHAGRRFEALGSVVPDAARRIVTSEAGEHFETVASIRLAPGDLLWVRAGEVIAADGVVEAGASSVDESILSGESLPARRETGARVLAGSVNLDAPLRVRVTALAGDSFAGQLARLVADAAGRARADDRIGNAVARWFVSGVLLLAAATALLWLVVDPSRWFSATLAVLVVSCPCALAIARPAALAAAHACLLADGVAVIGAGALERLAAASHVLFDKTGTLTAGVLKLSHTDTFDAFAEAQAIAIAGALAQASTHPLARALRSEAGHGRVARLEQLTSVAGRGASARVHGVWYQLGSREYLRVEGGVTALPQAGAYRDDGGKEAWLAHDGHVVARFEFSDRLREEAPAVLAWLSRHGYRQGVLSGDREAVVAAVAAECGADTWQAAMCPQDKLAAVRAMREQGAVVAMVGDGINDGPVMAGADLSLAVASASAPARQQADILLLHGGLHGVVVSVAVARRLARVIRQNLGWALAYNLVAIPLAVAGMLAPWAAALGMSLSSLVVVGNALTIRVPRALRVDEAGRDGKSWK